MCLKREVSAIDEINLSFGNVPLICLGTGWNEDRVVLSPDGKDGWLVRTEILLEFGVKLFVTSVIGKDVELMIVLIHSRMKYKVPTYLNIGVTLTSHQSSVEIIRSRIDILAAIGCTVGVLPLSDA